MKTIPGPRHGGREFYNADRQRLIEEFPGRELKVSR
jgi:hypothetical protein